jgi:hypothetical protein
MAGYLPHVSEGKGESHPAAHSPGSRSGSAAALPSGAQRGHMLNSNGHAGPRPAAGTLRDVLSGEDSAADDSRAVTSPNTAGAHHSRCPPPPPGVWAGPKMDARMQHY